MAKQTNRIADNIDIQVEIMPVPFEELSARATGETSADIRARVVRAREIQAARFADEPEVHCNAQMGPRHIAAYCTLTPDCSAILRKAMLKYDMSARAYDRILKVARTAADLAASETILPRHITEAISYRNLDKGTWGTSSLL